MTTEELASVQCNDISIQTLPGTQDFLILICKDKKGSNQLMEILRQNPFNIKIFIDESTGHYSLQFEFIDTEIFFRLDTGKSEANYPPLKKLKDERIKFITTGVWTGRSAAGKKCDYNIQLIRLGEINLNESFSQAKKVQFFAGRTDKEPPVVVLIYENYDHIFRAEADEAYNKLTQMTISKPVLEIAASGETVKMKIWDILLDVEVKIENLKYDREELTEFLRAADPNQSFAFVLGFHTPGDKRPVIAFTKREGFEIVTLTGYTYKK